MAIWIPRFNVAIAQMASGAERRVAMALEKQMPADVVVIPHYRWQVPRSDRAWIDAETDFVMFWPRRGVLVLEVKGGPVDFDAQADRWIGLKSRSPTEQARTARNEVADQLARSSSGERGDLKWRDRIVACPVLADVEREKLPPRVDGCLREHILGVNQLRRVKEELELLTEPTSLRCRELTPARCQELAQVLRPSCRVAPKLRHVLEDDESAIEWATERQLRVLGAIINQRVVFVRGSAGTGKTILGLSAVETWLQAGEAAYFLSRSRYLVEFLRHRFPRQAQTIFTIAGFLREVQGLDLGINDDVADATIVDTMLAGANLDRVAPVSVVLDEAQDLNRDLLEAFAAVVKYKRLWVLYDDQQVLHRGDSVEKFEAEVRASAARDFEPISVRWNLRNTVEIGRYAAQWVKTPYEAAENMPQGEKPTVVFVHSEREQDELIRRELAFLITDQHLRVSDVVVLSCLTRDQAKEKYLGSKALKEFGRPMKYVGEVGDRGAVDVASVLDFKGQERQVVLLVDTKNAVALNAFYMGGSRAKSRLWVVSYVKPGQNQAKRFDQWAEQEGLRI